jgi:hypothetical protein
MLLPTCISYKSTIASETHTGGGAPGPGGLLSPTMASVRPGSAASIFRAISITAGRAGASDTDRVRRKSTAATPGRAAMAACSCGRRPAVAPPLAVLT